ncbi:MAG: hypothetical protein KatS3mg059_0071 [Thermomicrobiales bacterium]|nr:MAG: hypothetical protein KatS3mg059_0071 [Thermomicrobiales bacterium]
MPRLIPFGATNVLAAGERATSNLASYALPERLARRLLISLSIQRGEIPRFARDDRRSEGSPTKNRIYE